MHRLIWYSIPALLPYSRHDPHRHYPTVAVEHGAAGDHGAPPEDRDHATGLEAIRQESNREYRERPERCKDQTRRSGLYALQFHVQY